MLETLFGFQPKTYTPIQTLTPTELHRRLHMDESIVLVDVRTSEEYGQGHIDGARLMPLSTVLQRSGELPKDRSIVFVCRSGARSHTACELITSQGFTNTINLVGGMIAWREAGLPVR